MFSRWACLFHAVDSKYSAALATPSEQLQQLLFQKKEETKGVSRVCVRWPDSPQRRFWSFSLHQFFGRFLVVFFLLVESLWGAQAFPLCAQGPHVIMLLWVGLRSSVPGGFWAAVR